MRLWVSEPMLGCRCGSLCAAVSPPLRSASDAAEQHRQTRASNWRTLARERFPHCCGRPWMVFVTTRWLGLLLLSLLLSYCCSCYARPTLPRLVLIGHPPSCFGRQPVLQVRILHNELHDERQMVATVLVPYPVACACPACLFSTPSTWCLFFASTRAACSCSPCSVSSHTNVARGCCICTECMQ